MNFIPSGRCRMDPSVPCCVVSCYTQCPGRCYPANRRLLCHCWDRTSATLLNNSQYAHLNNIQRRLGILHSFLAYILLWYASDLLQRYSAFGRNATANIHKHKLWAEATLCQIPLPLLKSRIEMVLPLLLLTSAASSAVGRHLMGANVMWPDPCRILIIYQTR